MNVRRRASRLAGFAVLPMFGVVTPLLALPAITHTNGAGGWTAIAVGQSVGAGGAVLVELGWALTGPQAIAAATSADQKRLYIQAAASKVFVLTLVAPIVAVLSGVLVTHHRDAAILSALGIAVSGLSPNWYFIGQGRPRSIFLTDTIPRVSLTLVGVFLLYAGSPLWTFAACSVFGYTASFALGSCLVGPGSSWQNEFQMRAIVATLRSQKIAVTGRGLSALYIGIPTSLVQAASPSSVAVFAAAERLVRMGLLVLQSVPNSLQRYLGSPTAAAEKARRIRAVLISQIVIGILAGLVVASMLPLAVDLLLTGTVEMPTLVATIAGGVAAATCISRGTGLILVNAGQVRSITVSAATGAGFGVTTIPLLAAWAGAQGAMTGLLIAELSVLAVQTALLVRGHRPVPTETPFDSSTSLKEYQ